MENTLPAHYATAIPAEEDTMYNSDPTSRYVSEDEAKAIIAQHGSLVMEFIKKIRPGMDLYRLAVPTIVLDSISLLEKLAEMAQPHSLLLSVSEQKTPLQRFFAVSRWFLAGLRNTPRPMMFGAKPYNPILGEQFFTNWDHRDGSSSKFVAEQVSHHPPISAFYMENEKHQFMYCGMVGPKSKFYGNSASTIMDGEMTFHIIGHEEYHIKLPHITARGIIWGTQYIEVNDKMEITCAKHGFKCTVNFKAKSNNEVDGYFEIGGKKKFTVSGQITSALTLKDVDSKREVIFYDVRDIRLDPWIIRPVSQQDFTESRRIWHKVTVALRRREYDNAATHKHEIEEHQRMLVKTREREGSPMTPKLFHLRNGEWIYNEDLRIKAGKISGNSHIEEPDVRSIQNSTGSESPDSN